MANLKQLQSVSCFEAEIDNVAKMWIACDKKIGSKYVVNFADEFYQQAFLDFQEQFEGFIMLVSIRNVLKNWNSLVSAFKTKKRSASRPTIQRSTFFWRYTTETAAFSSSAKWFLHRWPIPNMIERTAGSVSTLHFCTHASPPAAAPITYVLDQSPVPILISPRIVINSFLSEFSPSFNN